MSKENHRFSSLYSVHTCHGPACCFFLDGRQSPLHSVPPRHIADQTRLPWDWQGHPGTTSLTLITSLSSRPADSSVLLLVLRLAVGLGLKETLGVLFLCCPAGLFFFFLPYLRVTVADLPRRLYQGKSARRFLLGHWPGVQRCPS